MTDDQMNPIMPGGTQGWLGEEPETTGEEKVTVETGVKTEEDSEEKKEAEEDKEEDDGDDELGVGEELLNT